MLLLGSVSAAPEIFRPDKISSETDWACRFQLSKQDKAAEQCHGQTFMSKNKQFVCRALWGFNEAGCGEIIWRERRQLGSC